jgi:hypothetical protein
LRVRELVTNLAGCGQFDQQQGKEHTAKLRKPELNPATQEPVSDPGATERAYLPRFRSTSQRNTSSASGCTYDIIVSRGLCLLAVPRVLNRFGGPDLGPYCRPPSDSGDSGL